MRETNFIEQNKKKWDEFEQMLKDQDKDPDKLSELFVQITDDLSYAKTFYPNRSVRVYLNNLSQQVFYGIYQGKRNGWKNFKKFWNTDLPRVVYESRKELMLSLVIFILSMGIGVFSSMQDPEFAKSILGESYIKMTMENIESGDPMAVYKKSTEVDMLLSITYNNLLVAFRTFVSGVFLSVGTLIILIFNGIMVGTFQYFFIEKGLFWESFLSIWLHGTLEISSIIIAGGAGIKMGSGLIFPGTYSRMQAFKISARKGLYIMMGITPIFIFAAIIESFITRYTDTPPFVRLCLILVSLFFIVGYFVFLPIYKARKGEFDNIAEERLPETKEVSIDYNTIYSNGEIFTNLFGVYKKYFWKILGSILIVTVMYTFMVSIVLNGSLPASIGSHNWFFIRHLFDYDQNSGRMLFMINLFAFAWNIFYVQWLLNKELSPEKPLVRQLLQSLPAALMVSLILQFFFYVPWLLTTLLLVLLVPVLALWQFIAGYENKGVLKGLPAAFMLLGNTYGRSIVLGMILLTAAFMYCLMLDSPLTPMFFDAINWNLPLDQEGRRFLFIVFSTIISFIAVQMVLPLFTIAFGLSYFSLREIKEASSLKEKIRNFGVRTKNGIQK